MKQVRVSELKTHLSEHLREAEAGTVIEVLDRARPIARIVPIVAEDVALEIIPAIVPFRSVRDVRLPPTKPPIDVLALLREERGDR